MFSLLYYNASRSTAPKEEGDEATTVDTDLGQVKAFAKAQKLGHPLLLRDAAAFDGELERNGDEFPRVVVIAVDGDLSEAQGRIGEAYDKAGVEVTVRNFGDFDPEADAPSDGHDGDRFGGDIDKLKERATELGITFGRGTGYNSLLTKVKEAEAKLLDANQ